MQTVQNINDIKYFTQQWEIIDESFSYDVISGPNNSKLNYTTMPTFVADFSNCSVNSLPVLITEDRKIITNHVWPLISKYRVKPHKVHNVFEQWGEQVKVSMPPITQQFNGTWKYVWLPIDEYSAENPWHIWIDVISKFRLVEKRWSTNFEKYVFILSNPSKYFDKVCEVFFPDLKYVVMPKNETWRFSHLIVPSMSNYNDGILSPNMPAWLRHLANLVIKDEIKATRKVLITRKDAQNRNIKNQQDLLLALKGWESVTLEDLSIQDQVKTFVTASHVLSPHGAGLTNCLWMRPGTKVYELTHKAFSTKKVYPVLSHCLNLEHTVVLCETENIEGIKPKNKKSKDMVDLKIDIEHLLKILD